MCGVFVCERVCLCVCLCMSALRAYTSCLKYSELVCRLLCHIQVNPVKDGSQSFTVYDLCLDVDTHPSATVYVSGVGSIHVSVIDKVLYVLFLFVTLFVFLSSSF